MRFGCDYLVIATGYLNDFDVIPGLGPGGNACSITYLDGTVDAAWCPGRLGKG
jgi:hypothetical protein